MENAVFYLPRARQTDVCRAGRRFENTGDGANSDSVRPQWWSFAEVSQQGAGLILAKKSLKEKYFFDLTFRDVHMGCPKVPKSDFQSQFSISKIIRIFLIIF